MTLFDMIVGGVLLISGFIGLMRGAAKELTTVLAFIAAVVIALFSLRVTGRIGREAIDPDWLGNVAAIVVVFVIAYVILRVAAGAISKQIQQTDALSFIDRVIGVAFGLVRAFVLLGVFNLAVNTMPPERLPPWITEAKLYPLTSVAAEILKAFAPQGSQLAGAVAPVMERAVREGQGPDAPGQKAAPPPKAPPPGRDSGYGQEQRKSMDDLVERSR